jgi:AsmA family protein
MLKLTLYFSLHPLIYKLIKASMLVLGILLAGILYIALVGISITAEGMNDKIASMLSQNLGRAVHFDRAMQIEISAHPTLSVKGMHIANAKNFDAEDFATLDEAKLALDLWPLLRLRFQIEELSGSGVHIRLQRHQHGGNNWTLKSATNKPAENQSSPATQTPSIALENILARLDIKRVSLENLDVEYISADAQPHFFSLQSLVAELPAGEPVKLTLNGSIEKTHPYRVDFIGGTLAELANLDTAWPIDLKLNFLSSKLEIKGNISEREGNINVELGTLNLAEFEQFFQTKLPRVGAANIAGRITYEPGNISLDNLNGFMGKTTLKGELKFDYSGERPKVLGELNLPSLDLRPFINDKPLTDTAPPKGLAEVYRELTQATFNVKELKSMDADLTLRVGEWLNLPGNVHDAMLRVKLAQGRLTMPMQVNMADVKLSGNASADASVSPAKFKLSLGTKQSSIGNLAGLLLGVRDVKGQLGRFDLRMSARGDQGKELMQTLDVQMKVASGDLSYGNGVGERPVHFTLDNFNLSLPAGQPMRGELSGALLDKKFNASLHGGALATLTQDAPVPLDLRLQAGSAIARLHGVMQTTAQNEKSVLSFELTAPRSGEIASWLGLKPGADAAINLQGNFYVDSENWHLADFSIKLGRSDITADIRRSVENARPLIKLTLIAELLDAEQLQSLLPESQQHSHVTTPAAINMMDIPILPSGVSLADADLTVSIKRINSASPITIRTLQFDGKIRDGVMPISPFSANIADNNFSGAMSLDLRTEQPHAVFWVASDGLDAGNLLKKIGLAGNLDALIEHASFQLDLHSSHLGQLLEKSELLANFEGGNFTLTDANTQGKLHMTLDQGELKSAANKPISLKLQGSLNQAPLTVNIQTAKAVDLINPNLSLPFSFEAHTSSTKIKLTGDLIRPFNQQNLSLSLDMSGSRLDNLNALAQTSLPPWGPWSALGTFSMSEKGYEISSLNLQVGSSQLFGHGKLDMTTLPPRLNIDLTAPTIQLDDFKLGDWSLEKARPATPKKSEEQIELSKKANTASQQAQQILSPQILSRQNAYLNVQVKQVVSGQDMLGSGKLEARLENGHAALGPVLVNTPGGSASFLLKYEPDKKDVMVDLQVEAKNFDYGILARHLDHDSEMSGIFSLKVDVNSRTQYLSDIFKNGRGNIDFVVWPENLKSGLIDVWAVNVLMALLPAIDSSNESKINCAIGKFVLADGKLADKSILIDTSRMRVTGKGSVDFAADKVKFYVKPRAKTPQFLSLAVPIELNGSIDDFSVGVRARDAIGSVSKLITSFITVPLQVAFGKTIPADGQDVCAKLH